MPDAPAKSAAMIGVYDGAQVLSSCTGNEARHCLHQLSVAGAPGTKVTTPPEGLKPGAREVERR